MGTPPLGDIQPVGFTCVREVGPVFGHSLCGAPATWHLMWDLQTRENAIACDEHANEAHAMWRPADWHPLTAECRTLGSKWQECEPPGTGFCFTDETHPDLASIAALEPALTAAEPDRAAETEAREA